MLALRGYSATIAINFDPDRDRTHYRISKVLKSDLEGDYSRYAVIIETGVNASHQAIC